MTNGEKMIWASAYSTVLNMLVVQQQMTVSEASRLAVGAAWEAVLAANQVIKDEKSGLSVSAVALSALRDMLQ